MKITSQKLKQIIKEELEKELNEQAEAYLERQKSFFRDFYGKLSKPAKTAWNALGKKNKIKALKVAAGQLAQAGELVGGKVMDIVQTMDGTDVAQAAEKVLRSPLLVTSRLGITDKRKENAIACVWPNYRVGTGVKFRGQQIRIPFGHAGVCLVDPKGFVRWWNIGGSQDTKAMFVGQAGKLVGQVEWDDSGRIANIDKILQKVKNLFPKAGSLEAVIVRGVNYGAAVKEANKIPKAYSVFSRMQGENCGTYVVRVLNAGGASSLTADLRSQIIAMPRKIIPLLQNDFDERIISI